MREELQAREGLRGRFTATFKRFGRKTSYGYLKVTALLIDVKDESGKIVTDHVWFNFGKQMQELNLQEGDQVEFSARVTHYWKGYKGRREDPELPPISKDYRLSFPTKLRKIGVPEVILVDCLTRSR